MNYYIDVKIKTDIAWQESLLLNKVYKKLHETLYMLESNDIGVSFPEYHIKLGSIIRIHGTKEALLKLQDTKWLNELTGFCDVMVIKKIPNKIDGYRNLSYFHPKMTNAKLRRLIKRNSIPPDDIESYKEKMHEQSLLNPYIEFREDSKKQKRRLYIKISDLIEKPIKGGFNKYGLSNNATIPSF